jgi:hypothetical protein
MKKSAQVTFFIIIGILLAIGIISFFFLAKGSPKTDIETCQINSDCVPAACCHPDSCVLKSQEPDCSEAICTQECKIGTLDCNQGNCECVNSKCEAILN